MTQLICKNHLHKTDVSNIVKLHSELADPVRDMWSWIQEKSSQDRASQYT